MFGSALQADAMPFRIDDIHRQLHDAGCVEISRLKFPPGGKTLALAQQPQVVGRVVDEQAVLLQQSENTVTDFRPGRRITYHRIINAMHGISIFRDGHARIDEGIDERMSVVVQGGDFNDAAVFVKTGGFGVKDKNGFCSHAFCSLMLFSFQGGRHGRCGLPLLLIARLQIRE